MAVSAVFMISRPAMCGVSVGRCGIWSCDSVGTSSALATTNEGIKVAPKVEHPAADLHHARPLSHELPHGEGFRGKAKISRGVSARHATIGQYAHPNLLDCSIAVCQFGKLQRAQIS